MSSSSVSESDVEVTQMKIAPGLLTYNEGRVKDEPGMSSGPSSSSFPGTTSKAGMPAGSSSSMLDPSLPPTTEAPTTSNTMVAEKSFYPTAEAYVHWWAAEYKTESSWWPPEPPLQAEICRR